MPDHEHTHEDAEEGSNSVATILFGISGSISIVFGLILLLSTIRFYQCRHTIVLRKRYPKTVIVLCILFLTNLLVRSPLAFLHQIYGYTSAEVALQVIDSILYTFCSLLAITVMTLRFWMLFYKLNYTHAQCHSGIY